MRYCNKPNYCNLVGYNYVNHVDLSEYCKRRFKDNSNENSSKKSKSNKDKDNKDNKLKDKVYTTGNNSSSGPTNANIAVAKLDIIAYFTNSPFSARPWILNTGASRYIIGNLLVFTSTQNLLNLISITSMTG